MITVILPAYNEEQALPLLLDRLAPVQAALPEMRVFVIDDGSADGTADVVRGYEERCDWVQLISHPHNMGLSAGIQTGFKAATADSADDDIVVTLDADNTQPPELIPAMVRAIREEGQDVVIGSRFQPGAEVHGVPGMRRVYSWGMSVLFNLFFRIRGVRDYSCGFRAYRASMLKRAFERYGEDGFITEEGFSCMVEVLFQLDHLDGVKFSEVPMVLHYDYKPTDSKMNVTGTIRDTLRVALRHRWGRR